MCWASKANAFNRSSGTSSLLVIHDLDLARRCERIIEGVDGRVRS